MGFGHQLLMVSLAYRRRSILIAWSWVPYIRGHSTAETQLALLTHIHSLLPRGVAVLLVGDTEFGAVLVLQQLDQWRCTMFCAKRPLRMFVWRIKPIEMTLAAGLKKQGAVSGWAKAG